MSNIIAVGCSKFQRRNFITHVKFVKKGPIKKIPVSTIAKIVNGMFKSSTAILLLSISRIIRPTLLLMSLANMHRLSLKLKAFNSFSFLQKNNSTI
jgi:hypothetical protein